MKHYIFSYGSLINKESLALTIGENNAGKAKTVIIKGYERGWRNHVHPENRTGLGIIKNEKAKVNGVIFEVDEKYLLDLDKREYGFERREILNQNHVHGKLWAYFVIDPKIPTYKYPIALTYVDTVISGCLTQSEDFAREFLENTANWEYPFVNDRANPRFPRRASLKQNQLDTINGLLKKSLPGQYEKLKID